jgi:hypothetical protein
MSKRAILMCSSLLFVLFFSREATAQSFCTANAGGLDIDPVVQEEPSWCWVASAKTVLDHFNNKKDQCFLYNQARTPPVDCCNSPRDISACGDTGWPEDVFSPLSWELNTNYQRTGGALTWNQVKQEICPDTMSGRPFIYVIQWPNQPGNPHTANVIGFDETEEPPVITIDWHAPSVYGETDGIEIVDYECGYHHNCIRDSTDIDYWWNMGTYGKFLPPRVDIEPPSAPSGLTIR